MSFLAAVAAKPRLDEVIVTATRSSEPAEATLASVTVIPRAEIERSQALSLPDLLRNVAGLSLATNGGLGKATSLFIRGAESDQNLILIDGVRIGSITLGSAALQDLPLEQIERIEIVRGPRSALYGSEALGGVVQLFTRDGARASGLNSEFTLGGGSNSTQQAAAAVSGGSDRAYIRAGANYLETDGTNACEGFGAPIFAGCFTNEPDRDGYRNTSASLRGGTTLGSRTQLDAFALFSNGRVEYDGSFGNSAEFEQLTLGASLRQPLSSSWVMRLHAGRAVDDSENFANGTPAGRFDTTRDSFSALFDRVAGDATLTLGVDANRDRVSSTTRYVEDSRRTIGGFAQYRLRLARTEWLASVRHDDNEQFGAKTTGSFAWGMTLSPAWRITASGGTGFKAPTFNELYFPGFGNPNLEPETSLSVEASLRYARDATRASLTAFQSRVDDLIGFDANFSPVNIDETRLRGIEAELATRIRQVDLIAGADWLDAEDRSSGVFAGKALPRRPEQRWRLDVSAPFGPVRAGIAGQYVGERFDNRSNTRRLGGYAQFDLLAEWQASSALRLQARLANALDRKYATAAFYPHPGRELYVTLRFAPAR